MSRLHFFYLAGLLCSLVLPAAAETSQEPTPLGSYQLQNRSSFAPLKNPRPPFWPIGHIPISKNAGGPIAPVPTAKLDAGMFNVTSILLGNPSLAVINGRAYGEGEYIRFAKASGAGGARTAAARRIDGLDAQLRVRVIQIVDGGVTLRASDGQSVLVPLSRAELKERMPVLEEEELPTAE